MMIFLWMMCFTEMVCAVGTGYVERFYAGCIFLPAIVIAYAALEAELDERFFARIKAVKWTAAAVDGHLDDIKLKDALAKSEARAVLLDHCTSRGETSGSSDFQTSLVKMEPHVVGNDARKQALAEGLSEAEGEVMAKAAEVEQTGKNEVLECSGFYARAMRAVGSEGLALDKAMAGEDPDNVTLSGGDGVGLKVKTLGSKCVADTWKTVEDASSELAEMVSRAQLDEKIHIVKRLNDIQNTCHRLIPDQKLPYLKKLFTRSYRGIPEAENEQVMLKVEREWKMSLSAKSGGGSSSDSQSLKKENARLQAENARLQTKKDSTDKDKGMLCYLCQEKGHHIRNCPEQCKVCSTDKKHVRKSECDCKEE